MGKFKGVLLVSDFDDTLYNSRQEVSVRDREALDYFVREGGRFTLGTGRARLTLAPYLHLAPVNAPVVLSNGATLYDFERDWTVVDLPLPPSAAVHLTALCEAIPALGVEVYHENDIYIYHPNAHTARHMKRVKGTWSERSLTEAPTPWSKAVIQADHSILLEAQRVARELWPEDYEVIFSNSVLLEFTAKTATKGGMVLKLAELLGIQRRDIYCVGDNQNDIPMLAVSAIPFAPANCAQEVKDWGATIVNSCDEDCIAQIVGILDLRYS